MSSPEHPTISPPSVESHRSRSPSADGARDMEHMQPLSVSPNIVSGPFRSSRLACRLGTDDILPAATRPPLEEPVDLRLLDYVSDCDSNLICPICRCPLVDPVALSECEHCFCRDCLRETWQQQTYNPGIPKERCPTCRNASLPPIRASRILINILDDLVVKCPKHEEGCKAQVKRAELQEHVRTYCGYTPVPCPLPSCGLLQRRQDGSECLHHDVSCRLCQETFTVAELELHWGTRCADRMVNCELCLEPIYCRQLSTHKKDDCTEALLSCPGGPFGCKFLSKRAQAGDHEATCTFAALRPFLDAQSVRTKALESQQALASRRIQILEGGLRSIEAILQPQDTSPAEAILPSADTSAPAVSPPAADLLSPWPTGPDPGFTSPYTHLLSVHESLRDELSRVSAALADLDARHSMLILNENLRLKEDMAYLAGQVGGLGRQLGWLTSARLQGQQQQQQAAAQAQAQVQRGRTKL